MTKILFLLILALHDLFSELFLMDDSDFGLVAWSWWMALHFGAFVEEQMFEGQLQLKHYKRFRLTRAGGKVIGLEDSFSFPFAHLQTDFTRCNLISSGEFRTSARFWSLP